MEHYMRTHPEDDIRLTPRQCECWSCRANRGSQEPVPHRNPDPDLQVDISKGRKSAMALNHTKAEFEAHKEWRKPTGAEADAIEKATCTCHIDDGPACPVHVASVCETDGQQGE